jgi:hypothetical protein
MRFVMSGLTIADYEEVMADHRRLVRELDVLLNGEGAAKQASLCDIVGQVRREVETGVLVRLTIEPDATFACCGLADLGIHEADCNSADQGNEAA